MKKEVLVAILLGLGVGLIVTFGIYTARKTITTPLLLSGTPVPSAAGGSMRNSLVLLSPEDESIQAVKEVKVSGTTDPNAQVVIMINGATPIISSADNSGNFSIDTVLENGGNTILVKTLDDEGNLAEETRTVIFTTASLDEAPAASASPSPTTKAKPKPSASPAAKEGL